jgi:hypothetical protein
VELNRRTETEKRYVPIVDIVDVIQAEIATLKAELKEREKLVPYKG